MDAESRVRNKRRGRVDKFARFRSRRKKVDPRTLLKNPKTYSRTSTKEVRVLKPKVKRRYRPNLTRRYTAKDLTDSGNPGSLWGDSGQGGFLFAKNKTRKHGDIVVVNVLNRLKNEIAMELKRAFPPRFRPIKKKKKKAKKGEKEGEKKEGEDKKDTASSKPKDKDPVIDDSDTKVYDKISSVIVEEINKDYVLIRGIKDLLYKRSKHTVEVQSLFKRVDIADDDSINSNKALETSIVVLR